VANIPELKPFKTDYCTLFVDGTPNRPHLWRQCCFEHDLRYWFGGLASDQLKADKRLKQCVSKRAGATMANIMYYAIRAGHNSPVKHETHWGWGWDTNQRDFYQLLSNEEKLYITQELYKLPIDSVLRDEFVEFYQLNELL
tara:strand:+ start:24414 stop:24836 length:423 start_codon:yes stop_codon:yes gene_type:complete